MDGIILCDIAAGSRMSTLIGQELHIVNGLVDIFGCMWHNVLANIHL